MKETPSSKRAHANLSRALMLRERNESDSKSSTSAVMYGHEIATAAPSPTIFEKRCAPTIGRQLSGSSYFLTGSMYCAPQLASSMVRIGV